MGGTPGQAHPAAWPIRVVVGPTITMGERHLKAIEADLDVEQLELGQVLEFMQALWAVDHELQSSSKRQEAQTGVTGPQRLVIRMVGRFPGIAAGKVSDATAAKVAAGVRKALQEAAG